jgi:hypothetical protein
MDSKPGDPVPTEASGAGYHSRLFQFLRWQLSGVAPRRVRDGGWVDYEATRSHYNEASIDQKRTLVSTWVERLKPSWVLDLGCNLGEFSLICSQHGARVISADYDANCVEALYRSQRENRRIHPIVANLDDLSGGRGWGGEEFPGLATRLAGISDMVLALGLIHHLAITHSIPLPRIADFLHRCTNRFAIVECIAETDPLVARLCAQRGRRAEEFSLGAQIASLGAAFHVRESIDLSGTQRCLLLLEKNGT